MTNLQSDRGRRQGAASGRMFSESTASSSGGESGRRRDRKAGVAPAFRPSSADTRHTLARMKPLVIAAWGSATAVAILVVGLGAHQHYAHRACPPATERIGPVGRGGVGRSTCLQDRQLADQTLLWTGVAILVVVMGTALGCGLARDRSSRNPRS